MPEAGPHFEQELAISPGSAEAHSNYARALAQFGRLDEALAHFRQAVEAAPGDASVHKNLGRALALQGQAAEAIAEFEQAVQIDPGLAVAQQYLGELLYMTAGRTAEALAHWRTALRLQPDQPLILNLIARVLATSPDAALRNGTEAVSLAERAVRLSDGHAPAFLDTLAAAYAEAGPHHGQGADPSLQVLATSGVYPSILSALQHESEKNGLELREIPGSVGGGPRAIDLYLTRRGQRVCRIHLREVPRLLRAESRPEKR